MATVSKVAAVSKRVVPRPPPVTSNHPCLSNRPTSQIRVSLQCLVDHNHPAPTELRHQLARVKVLLHRFYHHSWTHRSSHLPDNFRRAFLAREAAPRDLDPIHRERQEQEQHFIQEVLGLECFRRELPIPADCFL